MWVGNVKVSEWPIQCALSRPVKPVRDFALYLFGTFALTLARQENYEEAAKHTSGRSSTFPAKRRLPFSFRVIDPSRQEGTTTEQLRDEKFHSRHSLTFGIKEIHFRLYKNRRRVCHTSRLSTLVFFSSLSSFCQMVVRFFFFFLSYFLLSENAVKSDNLESNKSKEEKLLDRLLIRSFSFVFQVSDQL